jgi:hypothetical protein
VSSELARKLSKDVFQNSLNEQSLALFSAEAEGSGHLSLWLNLTQVLADTLQQMKNA